MPTFHRVEIDGHMLDFDHVPSSTEVKQIQAKLAPPASKVPEGHPYLATAARVATPIVGGLLGAASPVPGGTAIGAGVGGALGETIAEKLEGRQVNPKEVVAQGAISAFIPGPGKSVLGGIAKASLHGAGSVTLDSLARTGEFPEVGQLALGTVFGGATGGLVTKLHLRSSLREVLPTDVADATHEVLTTGKLSTLSKEAQRVVAEDLAEVKATQKVLQRDAKGRFLKATEEAPVSKPTVRVKLGKDPSEYEFSTPEKEPTGQKFRWKRVGKGEYVKEPIDAPPSISGEVLEPIHRPEGQIGVSRIFTPQIWLFDRIQASTKQPVYDEVYRPIRDAIESGDKTAIRSAVNSVKQKYLTKQSPLPDDARRSVQHLVNMAQGVHDGVMQDLTVSIKRMASKIPGVRRYIDEKTAREFAANIATLQYQGTLPGRIGPLLRNSAQTLQTGYMTLGERFYWSGVKQGLSKEGFKKATQLGFLGPEHTIAAELEHSNSWYSRLIRAGFYPYQKIDDFNNAVMGLGQYERTLWAARAARANWAARNTGREVEEFIDRANLDLAFPKAEREQIAALYEKAAVDSRYSIERSPYMQEAARRAGLIRANTTQFLYGPAERPEVLTSTTIGRVGGGFGNWPAFYGNLLKELATGDAPVHKKAIAFARLTAAHGVLGVGAYGIYKGYGYDTKKARARAIDMVGFGPLFYGGGAALESFKTAEEAVRKGVEGEQSIGASAKELGRAARPLIPFGYAYKDYFGTSPVGKYPDASKEGYITKLRKTMEDR